MFQFWISLAKSIVGLRGNSPAHEQPRARASAAASFARGSWKSKLCTRPDGATARASECVSDPLPVPASSTARPAKP